jgi:uroporphyrin-III C-methyltransferase
VGQPKNDWVRSVAAADTAVIYMGAGDAAEIAAALIAHGVPRDTPAAIVENASLPEVRRILLTLEKLPQLEHYGFTGPTLIMLGRVLSPALAAAEETAGLMACRTA